MKVERRMTWLPRWLAAVVAFCAIASVHAQTPPPGVPCTALGRAVIANSGQVLLNSHTLVDSYQSNLGPYGGANIGDHGDIQAATNILQNFGAVIHGSTFANTPAGLQLISPPATAQNLGTFLLNSSQSATLAAGDYVASSFTLNSNSKLIIAGGQVRIWVTGALILGGAANQGGIPGNLQFLVTSTQDVHVNSGGSLFGAIYAPAAQVLIDAQVFGSVLGGQVTLFNSGGQVHFDESSACVSLVSAPSGVSLDDPLTLLAALQIQNIGTATAQNLIIQSLTLNGANLSSPSLPVSLGSVDPDDTAIIQARFTSATAFVPGARYPVSIKGTYMVNGATFGLDLVVVLTIPPAAPGAAISNSNTGTTHRTAGPYPSLPQPPKAEGNDISVPTPQGPFRSFFPPTAQTTGVQDPHITSFPGLATGSAAVGFVINTESNGNNQSSFPPDPSAVSAGAASKLVLATGNLYIKVSTDGGATFKTITDLSTVFGDQPDGGYCCDQVVHYIPSIDRVVWLIQTNQVKNAAGKAIGPNSERVAWARPADIVANFNTAWTWFDVSSTFLGLGKDWLDYPDISTSNGNLYISTDDVSQSGLVVARISYADLQLPAGSTVTWNFTDPTKSTQAYASHLTQNAAGTLYWAGHSSTSKMRIFSRPDNSTRYSWREVDHTNYNNCNSAPSVTCTPGFSYTSKAPDGQFWLDPKPNPDSVIGAVFKPFAGLPPPEGPPPRNQLWFAWTAGRDSHFPQPYIRMLMVDDQNFDKVGEFETWNANYAFAYPALAANSETSEVAISLMWGGGGNFFMNNAVGFPQDFLLYNTTGSDETFTVNPVGATGCDDASGGVVKGRCTRSGDYLSLRRIGTTSGLFGTLGYEIDSVDPTRSTDCLVSPSCLQNVRWIEFGRPIDVFPPAPPQ